MPEPHRTAQQIIGANIAARRRQKNITQQQLADAIGTSRRTLQRVEEGKASIDLDALPKLLAALEIQNPMLLLRAAQYE